MEYSLSKINSAIGTRGKKWNFCNALQGNLTGNLVFQVQGSLGYIGQNFMILKEILPYIYPILPCT